MENLILRPGVTVTDRMHWPCHSHNVMYYHVLLLVYVVMEPGFFFLSNLFSKNFFVSTKKGFV
jgi:hypothetical protein